MQNHVQYLRQLKDYDEKIAEEREVRAKEEEHRRMLEVSKLARSIFACLNHNSTKNVYVNVSFCICVCIVVCVCARVFVCAGICACM